jgi:hypothetical protein
MPLSMSLSRPEEAEYGTYGDPELGYSLTPQSTTALMPWKRKSQSSEDLLYEIARQILMQTKPLRDASIDEFKMALSGALDPRTLPQYRSLYSQGRDRAEGAFRSAMEAAYAMPAGGRRDEALANAVLGRADAVGSLPGLISQQLLGEEIARATGTAFGVPLDLSIGGLGTAAQQAAQRNAAGIMAGAQQDAAMMSTLSDLIGSGIGLYAATRGPFGGNVNDWNAAVNQAGFVPTQARYTGFGW